jgi:adenosylhomocysteine nucleosidase
MCIGLVVALPRELPSGFADVPEQRRGEWHGMRVSRWATTACEIVAVQAGLGEARAAAGAQLLMQHFAPQTLISYGFAGGLVPHLRPGLIVIGDQLMAEEAPAFRYQTAPELVATWCAAAAAEHLPARRGTVVTVRQLISDPSAKMELSWRTGACAVDMETVGVVGVACRAAVPCVALRAVVDTAEETLPVACLGLMRVDGRVDGRRLLRACWKSPGLLRHLFWLERRTATARRHLDRTLKRWARTPQLNHEQG